jgi:hypothetical protein
MINPEDMQPGAIVRTLDGNYAEVIAGSDDDEWFPVVYRASGEADLISIYEVTRLIPPPPAGLTTSPEDPAFAMGAVEHKQGVHGVVEAWRPCAEFVGRRWETFVSISKVRT